MGLDAVELVMDVEDHFGIVLREKEGQRIRTIDDLAATIVGRIHANSENVCPTMAAFFKVRGEIVETLDCTGVRIRPSSMLRELIPPARRQACWQAIGALQSCRFPRLQHSKRSLSLLLASVVAIWFAPAVFLELRDWLWAAPVCALISVGACVASARYRTMLPAKYKTVGDIARESVGAIVATKRTHLVSKSVVLRELMPIVSEQFGVAIERLAPGTRFVEDLGAG